MIKSKSKSICVKFREDDPNQMAVWEYLQKNRGSKTYAELITDILQRNGERPDLSDTIRQRIDTVQLEEIRQICIEIREKVSERTLSTMVKGCSDDLDPSSDDHFPNPIRSLMGQLSGEDEEE